MTLYQIFLDIFGKEKKYVIAGAVIGLLIAIFLILFLKPKFEVSMIVAPQLRDSRTDSFIEGVLVYAPDVEAKIPIGSPEFIRFEQSLRGATVSSLVLSIDGIVQKISDDGVWRGSGQIIKTAEELSLYLQKNIKIETIGATTSRKITYRHPDSEFGVKLLILMRKVGDQIIRTSVKTETEKKIEWLKTELNKTLNPDHRQALVQLLMSEERRRMLLSLDTPYAVNVVEEAASSPRPVTPNRPITIVLLIVIGAICGSVVSLLTKKNKI